jgi:urease accessory protein
MTVCTIMSIERVSPAARSLLRLQSWLSPLFPTGAYSYSHGLEWAVEAQYVYDLASLIEWLRADIAHGSIRNEAIFFSVAWRAATQGERAQLLQLAEVASAFRGTAEFALESAQQAAAALAVLRRAWPDPLLDWMANALREHQLSASVSVVLGARSATEAIPLGLALPAFLQSYVGNLVTAAVRLIPLGQTAGQLAVAGLEEAVLSASARAESGTLEELGSAAFMVDLASMAHETQYTRLFRS